MARRRRTAASSARVHQDTYESLSVFAAEAAKNEDSGAFRFRNRKSFTGVDTFSEAHSLAVHGWQAEEAEALRIVEQVVETVEREHDMDVFNPVHDVAGGAVDVGRFLSGEPECMIDFTPVPTSSVGRVITLCASISVSSAVSTSSIKRRGHGIAALAFALTRIGFAVELWADLSSQDGGHIGRMRVLVKGANDELDPARVMFAYAHPAMLRALCFGAMHSMPPAFQDALGVGYSYGCPTDPARDLDEGTIYLDSVLSDRDVPHAHRFVTDHLRKLGVIEQDS